MLTALSVVIDGVSHSAVRRVASIAEAELRAAGYAISLARPGHLTLHLDCALSATLLRGPQGKHPMIGLARAVHRLARLRGVEIEVVQIAGSDNPAHSVAYGRLQEELDVRRRSVAGPKT
ncbi:hypothetical protein [Deinococcus marmoris]|uniref:Uncharacterized protein n=1 Tax=Deinococcus marmoris TaxID=249408 RepID=A0A1U7NU03_9DEIO|nr:hypothetical protein [Deinococcus marmoris]OLV16385.1 hypothetical protein BOO71_0012064 [Deinococcus marmoris]